MDKLRLYSQSFEKISLHIQLIFPCFTVVHTKIKQNNSVKEQFVFMLVMVIYF